MVWLPIVGSTTDVFAISHGLKQEFFLGPTLLILFLSEVLSTVSEHLRTGDLMKIIPTG